HGRVVDRREFFWEDLDAEITDPAILEQALKQIYLSQPYVPPLISVPAEFEDRELLAVVLAAQRGAAVEIVTPQRGAKKELLELAARNARHSFQRRFRRHAPDHWAALAAALGLPLDPVAPRIECFDISHFQGAETVAAMVVWEAGRMRPAQYRKFRIRETVGVDDFLSMAEVVRRRYQRQLESGAPLPGLVLIDGGIGQLHAAQRALGDLGLGRLPLAALAKREELIFIPGREALPVQLPQDSPARQLLQMVRDEAHRFAITFHRQRRGKANLRSDLLEIPGIGPATVRRLLAGLGSLTAVQAASVAELTAVVAPARAQSIWSHFHSEPVPLTAPEKQ
ncbi:MAG: helix-hairpin-helix domain-containing protein, partial [Terriglobales bacterium]